MTLNTVALTPLIGTEIKADKKVLLSGAHAAEIRALLEKRGVLVIRGGDFSDDEQLVFSKTLGKVQTPASAADGLQNISLDPEVSLQADYLRGAFYWHIDGATDDVPNFAATLNPRKLSETGGSTYFANTYAAYEALPEDEKKQYEGLRVVHSLEAAQRMVEPEPSYKMLSTWQTLRPPKKHPLVWKHRSGRKSLVLGTTTDYVDGMDVGAGRLLLCKLREWATQPQFVYRHDWAYGDLLVWDNTGAMHRVDPYPLDSGRLLKRTTIDGEEAFA